MKPLILVVEHRQCRCGETYIAPNPRPLFNHELTSFHNSSSIGTNLREILHIDTKIEYCPKCFKTINGSQLELFPRTELPPFTLITNPKSPPKPQPQPFNLGDF